MTTTNTNEDKLILGGHEFTSRFIMGSGKFSLELMKACIEKAGAQIVTLALRRANEGGLANILDYVPKDVTLLPNTSGARNAQEAVRIATSSSVENPRPSELSGGMRQRAALIRTLVLDPDLLLLDEPFSALDYQTRLNVGDDIGQIIRQEGKSAVLVTHDLSEAISLADRIIVLSGRPANIRQTVPLIFDLEQDTPLNRRNSPEFKHYFNLIWKELNTDD